MDWQALNPRDLPSTETLLDLLRREGLLTDGEAVHAETILARLSGQGNTSHLIAVTRCEHEQLHAILLMPDDSLCLLHHADEPAGDVSQPPRHRCEHTQRLWRRFLDIQQRMKTPGAVYDYRDLAEVIINLPQALQDEAKARVRRVIGVWRLRRGG